MTRKVIATAAKNEVQSMELVQTKLQCVETAIQNPPPNMAKEDSIFYYRACLDSKAEYQWLEKTLWEEFRAAHGWAKDLIVNLSFDSSEFYVMEP